MRGYDLVALNAAGSGLAGRILSIMDITAALYLKANHDLNNSQHLAAYAITFVTVGAPLEAMLVASWALIIRASHTPKETAWVYIPRRRICGLSTATCRCTNRDEIPNGHRSHGSTILGSI
jgi:hypothetical protein